ncbi:MAG: hypothetical protein ABI806_23100 [Candidatus Solibacter sp.]
MHLDVALNLLWAAITLAAIAWIVRVEFRSGSNKSRKAGSCSSFQRLFAVCLMAVAIFPSISDSDDLFHFSLLQVPTSQTGGFGSAPQDERQEKGNLQLARLLETLENFQVSGFYLFLLTISCVAVSLSLRVATCSRSADCYAGRAPPLS